VQSSNIAKPSIEPEYPPLAKATHSEGDVTFDFEVDLGGVPEGLNIIIGHPLLNAAVQDAVAKWRFDASAAGRRIPATMQFALNCSR
jgi:TonB family protein